MFSGIAASVDKTAGDEGDHMMMSVGLIQLFYSWRRRWPHDDVCRVIQIILCDFRVNGIVWSTKSGTGRRSFKGRHVYCITSYVCCVDSCVCCTDSYVYCIDCCVCCTDRYVYCIDCCVCCTDRYVYCIDSCVCVVQTAMSIV